MSTADHIRESILLLLAQNGSLTATEIYEKIDTIETRQFLYAQINYLKKEGKITGELGGSDAPVRYKLTKPLKEIAEDEAVKNGMRHLSVPNETPYTVSHSSSHRFTWVRQNNPHSMSLVIKDDGVYLSARRSFPVTPGLLREMADTIEDVNQ